MHRKYYTIKTNIFQNNKEYFNGSLISIITTQFSGINSSTLSLYNVIVNRHNYSVTFCNKFILSIYCVFTFKFNLFDLYYY